MLRKNYFFNNHLKKKQKKTYDSFLISAKGLTITPTPDAQFDLTSIEIT